MTQEKFVFEVALPVIFYGIPAGAGLLLIGIGFLMGRDCESIRQARKDKNEAAKLRAAIREQDDNAPRPVQSPTALTRTTCARGPEICVCGTCCPKGRGVIA